MREAHDLLEAKRVNLCGEEYVMMERLRSHQQLTHIEKKHQFIVYKNEHSPLCEFFVEIFWGASLKLSAISSEDDSFLFSNSEGQLQWTSWEFKIWVTGQQPVASKRLDS